MPQRFVGCVGGITGSVKHSNGAGPRFVSLSAGADELFKLPD